MYYGTGNPGTWNPAQRPGDNRWSMTIFARDRRHGHGQVGLSDDAPRRVGLRRRQRDDPRRQGDRRRGAQGSGPLRPQRLRLHARSRDRRAARGREVRSGGQLGDPRRHGDRPPAGGARATRPTSRARTSTPPTSARRRSAPRTSSRRPTRRDTGLFYVPTNHVCMDYEPFEVSYTAGQPYVGATLSMYPAPGGDASRQLHRLGRGEGRDRVVDPGAVLGVERVRSRPPATWCSTARSRAT